MLKRLLLRFTEVKHENLVALGFDTHKLFYRFADLNIYVENKQFYFITRKGKKRFIKNMLAVSKLIYGKIDYLHV